MLANIVVFADIKLKKAVFFNTASIFFSRSHQKGKSKGKTKIITIPIIICNGNPTLT